jgi:DNA polymerase-3 subunit delta
MSESKQANSQTSSGVRHVFEFLDQGVPAEFPAVCVFFGSDSFLRHLAHVRLRELAEGAGGSDYEGRFDGTTAEYRDVADELRSASLFGEDRGLVVVDDADKFVSANRSSLERLLDSPGAKTLVLQVQQWLKTTRLHAQLAKTGWIVDCSVPQRKSGAGTAVDRKALSRWFAARSAKAFGRAIPPAIIDYVIDLVGTDPGIIDQELTKLSTFVPEDQPIAKSHVDEIGCGWRLRTTWDVLDAVLDGRANVAIDQLHRLFQIGQEPLEFFGAFSWSLRRFAAAAQHSDWMARTSGRRDIPESLRAAGFRNDFGANRPAKAEAQLRQLGYERCIGLSHRLLELDLSLKSSHSGGRDGRRLLEEYIVELSSLMKKGVASTA